MKQNREPDAVRQSIQSEEKILQQGVSRQAESYAEGGLRADEDIHIEENASEGREVQGEGNASGGKEVQGEGNASGGKEVQGEGNASGGKEVQKEGNVSRGKEVQEEKNVPAGRIGSRAEHNPVHAPIPGLGLRSMKTALAAVITALLYAFLPDRNPTFACIGAIFGMGADMEESRRSGGNRFFGTIIGGFIGLGMYWLEHQIFPEGQYWLRLPLVFAGIVIMISLCVLFRWPGGVQPGGVVLCIILFNTPAHHIDYAIQRMIDTGVGVVIALLVNYLLPRSRLEHWFHLDRKRGKRKDEQA